MNIHEGVKQVMIPKTTIGGAIAIQHSALSWLKQNLDIDLDNMHAIQEEIVGPRKKTQTMRNSASRMGLNTRAESYTNFFGDEKHGTLSEARLADLNRSAQRLPGRPRSNASRPMSAAPTHTTAMASHMSVLPELSQSQVSSVARTVFESRAKIIAVLRLPGARTNLRTTISSTQIYQILKRNGIYVELGHIKVLLKELGMPFNGPSTSFTMLFNAVKAYLNGAGRGGYPGNGQIRSDITPSEFSALL
jgi:hypothetical protein